MWHYLLFSKIDLCLLHDVRFSNDRLLGDGQCAWLFTLELISSFLLSLSEPTLKLRSTSAEWMSYNFRSLRSATLSRWRTRNYITCSAVHLGLTGFFACSTVRKSVSLQKWERNVQLGTKTKGNQLATKPERQVHILPTKFVTSSHFRWCLIWMNRFHGHTLFELSWISGASNQVPHALQTLKTENFRILSGPGELRFLFPMILMNAILIF